MTCRLPLIIDDQPARAAAYREFLLTQEKFIHDLQELLHHEKQVRPAYTMWVNTLFAEKVQKIQVLKDEIAENQTTLEQIKERMWQKQISRKKAYLKALNDLAVKKNGEQNFPAQDVLKEKNIKFYYRKIAQSLHPDSRACESEVFSELWLQTQQAYRQKDLSFLKFIWILCLLQENPTSRAVAISDFRFLTESLNVKLLMQKNLRRIWQDNDPTWNFEKKDKKTLQQKVFAEMQTYELELSQILKDLHQEINSHISQGA